MNNTVNLILNTLGNDEYNFYDDVYSACDQMEQIKSIEQFSDLKWEAVIPHIDQILFEYNEGCCEDGIDTIGVYEFKKLFQKTQFAAVKFLQSEAMRDFWKKIQKDELR